MKQKKTSEAYFFQKDTRILEAVFMGMVGVGAILVLLWTFFYIWVGFFGLPLLIVGGGGWIFTHSSRVTEEDFDKEVKRVLAVNGIEENDTTLKEFIVGKSDVIKLGADKRIRTPYYSVAVFDFKKEVCDIKRYTVDLFEEKCILSEKKVKIGCSHSIDQRSFNTAVGEMARDYLILCDEEPFEIPVNMNVYDTDAVIKRITHKR